MSDEITSAVILDTGSGFIKAGLAQIDFPSVNSPSAVATPLIGTELEKKKLKFGHSAIALAEDPTAYQLTRPISRGIVQDWDALENLWHNLYLNELKVDPSNHPVVTSVYPDEQKHLKERMSQIFFETFNIPGLYTSNHSLLALYGSGKTSGLVVDSGFHLTTVTPIIDGYCRSYAHTQSPNAGDDVNSRLINLLGIEGKLNYSSLEEIKKTSVYVADDYETELEALQSEEEGGTTFQLPDGQEIVLEEEVFKAAEGVFNPMIVESREPGLVGMITECVSKVEIRRRAELLGNVILCGGNTKLQNFVNRLEKDLRCCFPASLKVKIHAGNDRQFLTWSGGAVVSALSTFQTMWITQADYDENGPSVVHRKCL
jgi:actin-related protein